MHAATFYLSNPSTATDNVSLVLSWVHTAFVAQ